MINCRRPSNRSSRLALPLGPSNSYSFSTASHGIRRRSAASASRARVKAFSLTSSSWRAASHSCGETIGGVFIAINPSVLLSARATSGQVYERQRCHPLTIGCRWAVPAPPPRQEVTPGRPRATEPGSVSPTSVRSPRVGTARSGCRTGRRTRSAWRRGRLRCRFGTGHQHDQAVHFGGDVADDQVDPVPAAGARPAAVGHRPPGGPGRTAQEQPEVATQDVGEGGRKVGADGEAEVRGRHLGPSRQARRRLRGPILRSRGHPVRSRSEACPEPPSAKVVAHCPNPAEAHPADLDAFRAAAEELDTRVRYLLPLLGLALPAWLWIGTSGPESLRFGDLLPADLATTNRPLHLLALPVSKDT